MFNFNNSYLLKLEKENKELKERIKELEAIKEKEFTIDTNRTYLKRLARAYNNKGLCLLDLGRYAEAKEMILIAIGLEKSTGLNPYKYYDNLGIILSEMKNNEEALEIFDEVIIGLKNILGSEEKLLEILNELIIEVESQSHKSELYRNDYIDLENIKK